MSLIEYARNELRLAGLFDKDSDYAGEIGHAVMEIVETFSKQRHSGYSANLVSNVLNKVLKYQPLTPLTGEDSEWERVYFDDGEETYQNKRCYSVFKDSTGVWDNSGIAFRNPDGSMYTNRDSRVAVTFPYIPERIIKDSPDVGMD